MSAPDFDALRALDPTLVPTEAELAATAKEAERRIAAHVEKGAVSLTEYERALRLEFSLSHAQETTAKKMDAAVAATYDAREKLLAYVTHPLLVSRDAREDDAAEIAYLRETCTRQQKELAALRSSTERAFAHNAGLEESNKLLRMEAEEISRILAKDQESASAPYEWPLFLENSVVRFIADARGGTDVPICAGDSVLVVAKVMAVRLKHLRERPAR